MSEEKKIKYLSAINSPEDFRAIPKEELDALADEIRSELVRTVSKNGGHLASNLGVVELTMALHSVFKTPHDHIIFDVGHQSYVHKMLSGRYADMELIRQAGGISGFQKRAESEHDCFGAGHSSTSLSAALGFAVADRLSGSDAYTVAVVGDGAYTGGMIHEALNNCRKDLNLIIILNENEMSISRNIGRFATSLSKLRTSKGYFKTKRFTGRFLKKIPLVGELIFRAVRRVKIFFKNAIYGTNYFESMGLTYLGPVDGNDFDAVQTLLTEAKNHGESVLVHVKTKKGKGFEPAESAPSEFHSMRSSLQASESQSEKTFSNVFGAELTKLAQEDNRICAITAAMSDGTGLEGFKAAIPERFFDVGIAEAHALTFCAGLSAEGMKPCAAIYSTFLQRGYDSIVHDIALQNLPCVIAIDRAGLNPKDGPTHHGIFDVSFLSHIPNMKIYTPISNKGLKASLREAFSSDSPVAVRYPSGYECKELITAFYSDGGYDDIGIKSSFCGVAPEFVIITYGRIAGEAVKAASALEKEGIEVGVILLEILKPYDKTAERIKAVISKKTQGVIFLEEEIRSGGMGMNLADKLGEFFASYGIKYDILATDDSFAESCSEGQSIYELAGVDASAVVNRIKSMKK